MRKKCDDFKRALKEETIIKIIGEYYIRGKPSFSYDGDGIFCDMTLEIRIYCCPFCGGKLT